MSIFQDLVRQERIQQGTPELQAVAAKHPDTLHAWQNGLRRLIMLLAPTSIKLV